MKALKEEENVSSYPLKIFSQKILILLAFAGVIYMLSLLSSILIVVFFSLFLTILFSSLLDMLNKKKIPDWLGIIFIFLGIFLFFFVALFAIIPIFVKQLIFLIGYINDSFSTLEALYKSGGIDAL